MHLCPKLWVHSVLTNLIIMTRKVMKMFLSSSGYFLVREKGHLWNEVGQNLKRHLGFLILRKGLARLHLKFVCIEEKLLDLSSWERGSKEIEETLILETLFNLHSRAKLEVKVSGPKWIKIDANLCIRGSQFQILRWIISEKLISYASEKHGDKLLYLISGNARMMKIQVTVVPSKQKKKKKSR